ncbi:MAG: NADH-quinone oxidoreductase subunit C [Candidatus Saganbacteria bacterium]|nr:NADH-quinone oxidoreductase subunit C [Candidatus Saganbacteria bacterium]
MNGKEEEIKRKLEQKFPALAGAVRVQRARRLWLEVPLDQFAGVFDYAVKEAGFTILGTISGVDDGADLGLLYHLDRPDGVVLNLKTRTAKDGGVMQSVTPYFPAAAIYEREIIDLLGGRFTGLPEGLSYPLPDDWPKGQCPLRKDWDPSVLERGGK